LSTSTATQTSSQGVKKKKRGRRGGGEEEEEEEEKNEEEEEKNLFEVPQRKLSLRGFADKDKMAIVYCITVSHSTRNRTSFALQSCHILHEIPCCKNVYNGVTRYNNFTNTTIS